MCRRAVVAAHVEILCRGVRRRVRACRFERAAEGPVVEPRHDICNLDAVAPPRTKTKTVYTTMGVLLRVEEHLRVG